MTTEEILSFYNIAKSIMLKNSDVNLNITKTFLTGYSLMIYESWGYTYTFHNYKQSLNSIINAMKVNLGLLPQEEIKQISFSINKPYEKEIVGYEYYNEAQKSLMPNLIGSSESYAKSWASATGRTINVVEVESSDSSYSDGQIINQSVHEGVIVDKIPSTITIEVIRKKVVDNPIEPEKPDENPSDENEETDPVIPGTPTEGEE